MDNLLHCLLELRRGKPRYTSITGRRCCKRLEAFRIMLNFYRTKALENFEFQLLRDGERRCHDVLIGDLISVY